MFGVWHLARLRYLRSNASVPAVRGALRVLLTFALGAMCAGYFEAEKQVTLTDDGRVITVNTFAPTVGAALVRLGISVGPDDLVVPTPEADLSEDSIEVRRARDVIVVLNGSRRVERVTGRTVEQVLRELAIETKGILVFPSPSELVHAGDEILVSQPVQVTVIHDGISQPVVTNVMTAGALMRELGIVVGPFDRVEPSIVASPREGPITVVRVSEAIQTVHVKIGFRKTTEKSDQLDSGIRKLKTAGIDGIRAKSYRVVYENGVVESRTLQTTAVVKPARNEVVLVGTRRPTVVAPSSLTTGKASWYRSSGLTAAHRTLPMGTVVRVTNIANAKQVTVTIRDRGPFVNGWLIDLSESAFSEIASTSTGVINVKLEW